MLLSCTVLPDGDGPCICTTHHLAVLLRDTLCVRLSFSLPCSLQQHATTFNCQNCSQLVSTQFSDVNQLRNEYFCSTDTGPEAGQ